jgi:hypothetical protein
MTASPRAQLAAWFGSGTPLPREKACCWDNGMRLFQPRGAGNFRAWRKKYRSTQRRLFTRVISTGRWQRLPPYRGGWGWK